MLLEYVGLPVQVGFDVATSLTIIGSLLYLVITLRRANKREHMQRLNTHSRSVAAGQLQSSLDILAREFIQKIVASSQDVSRSIKLQVDRSDFDLEAEHLKRPGQLQKVISNFDKAIEATFDFWGALHAEKYKIIPVMDALETESDLVNQFNKQLRKLEEGYKIHRLGAGSLIRELINVHEQIEKKKQELGVSSIEDIHESEADYINLLELVAGIFYDSDYLFWTRTFISEENKEAFEKAVNETSSTQQMAEEIGELFRSCCSTFLADLADNPDSFYKYSAQVFWYGTRELEDLATACKKLLISLSGILTLLLRKDSASASVTEIIKRFEDKQHFDLEGGWR